MMRSFSASLWALASMVQYWTVCQGRRERNQYLFKDISSVTVSLNKADLLMRRCWRRILMKSKVLKPRSNTSWFSHSLSSLAVCKIRDERMMLTNTNLPALNKNTGNVTNLPWGFLRPHLPFFVRRWRHRRTGWADAGAKRRRCLEDVNLFSSLSSRHPHHRAKWKVIY